MHVYLTRWRLAHGLAWRTHRPDLSPALRQFARGCGMTAVLIVVYGLVGRLEYQDAVAAEAEARARIAEQKQLDADYDLAACLNGARAWVFVDPRTGRRTWTRCKGSEEIHE